MGMNPILSLSPSARILLIIKQLRAPRYWPPWCNTNLRQGGDEMMRHVYFSHYRRIRGVIITSITIGAAMLLSYFILLAGA